MIYAISPLHKIPAVCLDCYHCGHVSCGGDVGWYRRCNITLIIIADAETHKTRPEWCPLVEVTK